MFIEGATHNWHPAVSSRLPARRTSLLQVSHPIGLAAIPQSLVIRILREVILPMNADNFLLP